MQLQHKVNIFLACFLLFSLPLINHLQAQEKKKILGPYLQRMSHEDVTIRWSTWDGSTKIEGPDGKVQKVNQYQHHQTILTHLSPNTTYSYDVLSDGSDLGKGTFTTFPEKIEPFHFVVLGDTRTRHEVHQRVVNRVIDENPLFVVNSGDLVGNGNHMEDWEHFFRVTDKLIRNVPYFTVLGNHEKDSENYYDFFTLPGNEHYYFFTVGDALFIILDMEGPHLHAPEYLKGEKEDVFWQNVSLSYFEKEKTWLERTLSLNENAGYIFVFAHGTFYNGKKSRLEESALRRKFWGDIFERHGVQAVISGHDHYYLHAENGGTHYIISAGGGAPLYDIDAPPPEAVHYKKIEHYMRIDVGQERATMKAIDINGELIEEITVDKRK